MSVMKMLFFSKFKKKNMHVHNVNRVQKTTSYDDVIDEIDKTNELTADCIMNLRIKHNDAWKIKHTDDNKINNTYESIMNNKKIRDLFINFCASRLCLENVHFIEHVICLTDDDDMTSRYQKIVDIYEEFLSDDAMIQINTTRENRKNVKQLLDQVTLKKSGDILNSEKNLEYVELLTKTLVMIATEINGLIASDTMMAFVRRYSNFFY